LIIIVALELALVLEINNGTNGDSLPPAPGNKWWCKTMVVVIVVMSGTNGGSSSVGVVLMVVVVVRGQRWK
jgi:hypothetical protein